MIKYFVFDIDETLLSTSPKYLNNVKRRKSIQNPYHGDNPCFTINKLQTSVIMKNILKNNDIIAFVTTGGVRKYSIKQFCAKEYSINLNNRFYYYANHSRNKVFHLRRICAIYSSSPENVILIDNNSSNIYFARKNRFSTIYADTNQDDPTHGIKYIAELELIVAKQVITKHFGIKAWSKRLNRNPDIPKAILFLNISNLLNKKSLKKILENAKFRQFLAIASDHGLSINQLFEYSAQHKGLDVIKELISAGADVSQAKIHGIPFIFWAIKHRHLEIMEKIIEYNPDLSFAQFDWNILKKMLESMIQYRTDQPEPHLKDLMILANGLLNYLNFNYERCKHNFLFKLSYKRHKKVELSKTTLIILFKVLMSPRLYNVDNVYKKSYEQLEQYRRYSSSSKMCEFVFSKCNPGWYKGEEKKHWKIKSSRCLP